MTYTKLCSLVVIMFLLVCCVTNAIASSLNGEWRLTEASTDDGTIIPITDESDLYGSITLNENGEASFSGNIGGKSMSFSCSWGQIITLGFGSTPVIELTLENNRLVVESDGVIFYFSKCDMNEQMVNVLSEHYISPKGLELLSSCNMSASSMTAGSHCSQYETMLYAIQIIDDTKYNSDSDIYGKIGKSQYKIAIQFVLGEDTKSDEEIETALQIAKKYCTKNNSGISYFCKDLIKAELMDENGYSSITIDSAKEKLGIGYDMLIAMLGELSLYQEQPLTWYRAE